jgi:hypothetical protein
LKTNMNGLVIPNLPKGDPAYPSLYPLEHAALLAADGATVPLCYRLLWGFLSREGCREGGGGGHAGA